MSIMSIEYHEGNPTNDSNRDIDIGDEEDQYPTSITRTVSSPQAGQRLDRYIAAKVEELSRSSVANLMKDSQVTVNGLPCKPSQSVRDGDVVIVHIPPPQPSHLVAENIPLTVVYEDEDVVVVEKEAGMVVHPAPGHATGTLVHALLYHYPDMHIGHDVRPGIVHRLDQDTSGLLVVARNDRAMRILSEQQKARTMHKGYLALVEGRVKQEEGTIDAPIGRHHADRKRQAITAGGREARTHYRVAEELGEYTLLEVRLETGRTHQIRVHCTSIHHPVLADTVYGPRKPRATFGLKRQFLHAYQLGFCLPSDGSWQMFTSPLPPDLAQALAKVRAKAQR